MVHIKNEMLGNVIKEARQRSGLTMEEIPHGVRITPPYLYRFENEGKKPSFEILYALIRELSIAPDLIFYPEKPAKDAEVEELIRKLYRCDRHSLDVVQATINALLHNSDK